MSDVNKCEGVTIDLSDDVTFTDSTWSARFAFNWTTDNQSYFYEVKNLTEDSMKSLPMWAQYYNYTSQPYNLINQTVTDNHVMTAVSDWADISDSDSDSDAGTTVGAIAGAAIILTSLLN